MRAFVFITVISQSCLLALGFPFALSFEPSTTYKTTKALPTVADATPRPIATPWAREIPTLINHVVQRATGSEVTPSSTPAPGNAQLVLASTKASTLPPAICGFIPWWNGTSTVIGNVYRRSC